VIGLLNETQQRWKQRVENREAYVASLDKRWHTVREAAEIIGIHEKTLYR
jgi:hypothetical protein